MAFITNDSAETFFRTMDWLDKIPYTLLIILSLTLGLAPFTPVPHLVEKIAMLLAGELARPVDVFDLLMHASPVVLLIAKVARRSGTCQ